MADKPNILLITTDTQRCDTLKCMGHDFAKSPHLDRMAWSDLDQLVRVERGTMTRLYVDPVGDSAWVSDGTEQIESIDFREDRGVDLIADASIELCMSTRANSPRANSPRARDIAYHLHPYTNLAAHEELGPHIITEGDGIYVIDDSGKRFIEGLAGLWCAALGFSEPRLVEAAAAQMRKLPYYHGFAHKATLPAIDLAERLIEMAPAPMSKVFFTNSGSEANDTQIKLVRYYNNALGRPDKKKIISRRHSYHGVTLATASLTGLAYVQDSFDLPIDGIVFTDCPHYWRFGRDGETEDAFATRMAASLDEFIVDLGPETVAAFIAEPVQGAGGVVAWAKPW